MGKRKFNEKGRQVKNIVIDNTEAKQIKLDIDDCGTEYGGYDQANALVLPSKKRDTKVQKTEEKHITRILSKKQRKNLEKIVDKKKKKENRSELLEKLASVQLPSNDLKKFTSITKVQTTGLKKFSHFEGTVSAADVQETDSGQKKWSSIAGKKRNERLALLKGYGKEDESDEENEKSEELNIIGTEVLSESESEDDDGGDEISIENVNIEEKALNEKHADKEKVTAIDSKEEDNLPNEKIVKQKKAPVVNDALQAIDRTPAVYVHLDRTAEVQAARLQLPILGEEQVIMETIRENNLVILAGETGSGKTTQVPQFLYEAGYAEKKMIGVTEPRRVAAISMSKRVAYEMNLESDVVSYLIRFEGNTTDKTKIKFMTDGVLLKEIESDFLLTKYSVIILDEAHERSVYTDILVGLLSRIVPLRHKRGNTLKLIIMSATLRVEDFTNNKQLFKIPPPVLSVEARQYPVTIHFNKRTAEDYVKEAYNKTIKIHSQLPEGGILIFLTGQQEVNNLVRKLRKAFPYKVSDKLSSKKLEKKNNENETKGNSSDQNDSDQDEYDIRMAIKEAKRAKKRLASQVLLPLVNLDDYQLPVDDTEADLLEQSDDENSEDELGSDTNVDNLTALCSKQPLWVLPLYSLLSSYKQQKVFEPPPKGTRLCIVTTNVAETSLTIPNIKYVVDSGRQKARLYDKVTGVSAFVVTFASKAAANQRAGRAGRTAPGHCYRLYSSAKYNDDFVDFAMPDIQKKPVEDLVLQMKCMGIDKVVNFPFPSPPDTVQLKVAEYKLKLLGALEHIPNSSEGLTRVTSIGRAISAFPVAPRFGKMLALSHQQNLLPYTTCMVAALSVQEILIEVSAMDENEQKVKCNKWTAKRKTWAGIGNSLLLGDPVVLLRAVGAAEYANSKGKLDEFCRENGLRPKAISEVRKLRIQLTNEINLSMCDVDLCVDPEMTPPTDIQSKLLRQILLSGMCDQVARLIPDEEINDKNDKRKFKYAYKRHDMEDPVFLHSSSVLRSSRPEWLVYQEIYELQNGDTTKMFMRGVTAIEPEWLLIYAKSVCNIKTIKEDPPPKYNENNGKIYCFCEATFGKSGWEIPLAEIEMPVSELLYKYFAMFFLNGDIFIEIQKYRKLMRSSPKNIVKSWAKNNPHILGFVNALIRNEVCSKQKLLDVWKKDQFYLLQEFKEFLIDSAIDTSIKWPPMK